jgi:hypothetical protein
MNKTAAVVDMLRPNSVWRVLGDSFEGIEFIDCKPITKAEFEKGCLDYDKSLAVKEAEVAETKTALLQRLGITEAEAKILLT